MSWTASSGVPSGTRVVMVTRYSMVRLLPGKAAGQSWIQFSDGLAAGAEKIGPRRLGAGRAEVGEVAQQVVVRLEAGRRDLAVGQPGESQAVHVIGEHPAVGVGGGPGAVVVQDVGQYFQGRRLGRFG